MLDLHCHLLPGVDDGATDLDEAVAMARAMVSVGFSAVAASPHHGGGPGGDVPAALATAARRDLSAELSAQGIELSVLPGAESVVTPALCERAARGELVPIGGQGSWLLVELPWLGSADYERSLAELMGLGKHLLLAHPERHDFLSIDAVARLVERGVRTQLELGVFAGAYGDAALARAMQLVERGLGHVLATDLHSAVSAERELAVWLAAASARLGGRVVTRALADNPAAILADAAATDLAPFSEAT